MAMAMAQTPPVSWPVLAAGAARQFISLGCPSSGGGSDRLNMLGTEPDDTHVLTPVNRVNGED